MSENKLLQEFVPYELSLDLKELGFDEPCLACYTPAPAWMKNKTPIIKGHFVNEFKQYFNSKLKTENVAAPLYQQAFRWFREKYDVYHFVTREVGINTSDIFFVASYYKGKKGNSPKDTCISSRTYEEAELECLKKLIEIVKSQKTKSIT